MTKNKETLVLGLSLLVTSLVAGGGYCWLNKSSCPIPGFGGGNPTTTATSSPTTNGSKSVGDRLSNGEKSLFTAQVAPVKKEGLEALTAGNFDLAVTKLEESLKNNPNDPEALIFLNNARIGSNKSYTVAVVVPTSKSAAPASEILRGVAQAQDEINRAGGIKGTKLKVAIADDDDDKEITKQIATEIVNKSEVLGVICCFSSDATIEAGAVFDAGQLVTISPTSTSVKISESGTYVFRTVPNDRVAATALANYMLANFQKQNAAVFFNSQSGYSQSLKSEFTSALLADPRSAQVSSEADLSDANFSASQSIEQATKQGAQVLMLAPNTKLLKSALEVVQVNRKKLFLLGGDAVYNPSTLELGGDGAVGMVVAAPWDIDNHRNSPFVANSTKLWKAEVNWRTALSYDAAQALIAALDRNPTRTGVQQAMSASDFSATGASGTVRFVQPSGDRNANVELVKVVANPSTRSGYDFVPVKQQNTLPSPVPSPTPR
jgi:branched-chain amino acid transport system substrate-binding protein